MPASLNCPTCGAPAPGPDATRCGYCGSTLTSIACPACFGTLFAGMEFCPHCGARAARSLGVESDLKCPACRTAMRNVQVGTATFTECPTCSGTWVDAGTFARISSTREERGAVVASLGTVSANVPRAVAGGPVRYLPCPACERLMNRENFGRQSGVIMDVCKAHGVWLEAGELRAVMTFIENGGLERARARTAEQHEADLQLQRIIQGDRIEAGDGGSSMTIRTVSIHSGDRAAQPSMLEEILRNLFH